MSHVHCVHAHLAADTPLDYFNLWRLKEVRATLAAACQTLIIRVQ